jgi:hypothetical protein
MYPGSFGSAGVEDAVGLGRCEERVSHVEYRSRVALASWALTVSRLFQVLLIL